MNKFVLGLSCILFAIACTNAQPTNQKLDLWVRYQDRIYNFWRSHGYTQARNQKQVWRLPNTFRINREAVKAEEPAVESTIPTCYFTGSTVICGQTHDGFNQTVECAVAKRFDDSLIEQLEIFALSEKRIVELPTGQNVTKFYLYARYDPETVLGSLLVQRYGQKDAKRPVVSLHAVDSIQDNGFTVIDPVCWTQLVDFLSSGEHDSVMLQGSSEERLVSGALIFL